jgi:hypothetical protein
VRHCRALPPNRVWTWVADNYRRFVQDAALNEYQESNLRRALGAAYLDREIALDMPLTTEADPHGKEWHASQTAAEKLALARMQTSVEALLAPEQLALPKQRTEPYGRLTGVQALLSVQWRHP